MVYKVIEKNKKKNAPKMKEFSKVERVEGEECSLKTWRESAPKKIKGRKEDEQKYK